MAFPTNEDIAIHLQHIGHLFTKSKQPGDSFRSQAFSRAAGQIRTMTKYILNEDGIVGVDIPGVGKGIRDVINEFAGSGTSTKMERLKQLLPEEVVERFDAKVCKRKVNQILEPITKAGIDWGYAGSMRRGLPTVRDVDVIVCLHSDEDRDIVLTTIKKAGLKHDIRDGEQKVGITVPIAAQGRAFTLDLNFCIPDTRGSYYLYFTGPKGLNIRMRSEAKRKGLLLNQYGLWRDKTQLASKTEEEVFQAMGMAYIAPEHRA